MKKAFSLVEMLVVITIIGILAAASLAGYSKVRKSAERTRAAELVSQVKTSLEAIFDKDGRWPKTIRTKNASADSIVDDEVAFVLVQRELMGLSYRDEGTNDDGTMKGKMTGTDRFGILSPWGVDVLKRKGKGCSLTTVVSGDATIKDHLLRFKVDVDGDGLIPDANVGGSSIAIRARVAVWCAGQDGKMETYENGLRSDDVYSWSRGQTVNAK